MKYFAIAPLNHLDLIEEERHHMVITPFLMDNKVMKFYREQKETGAVIMLDNGEFEDVALTNEEYIGMIEEIEPDIICLPDAWKNPNETMFRHSNMLELLAERGLKPVCMFIPHGNNVLDYMTCLAGIVNHLLPQYPSFEFILGLTFAEWGDMSGMVRPFLSHHLMKHPGLIHLLGLYNTRELWTCGPDVVSVDSSFPFKAALNGRVIDSQEEMVITDKFDFHARLSDDQIMFAKANLSMMHYLAESKDRENPFEVLR